jgi:hypothetical protein
MGGVITSLPNTPSWRGVQLKSTGENLPLRLPQTVGSVQYNNIIELHCCTSDRNEQTGWDNSVK